jgi:hypothetical protein
MAYLQYVPFSQYSKIATATLLECYAQTKAPTAERQRKLMDVFSLSIEQAGQYVHAPDSLTMPRQCWLDLANLAYQYSIKPTTATEAL